MYISIVIKVVLRNYLKRLAHLTVKSEFLLFQILFFLMVKDPLKPNITFLGETL